MAPERVTVTVQSSVGEDANLTVSDAMRQVLDFFDLLSSAGGEDASKIRWQLVAVSMSSPLQVTAQAVPAKAGVIAEVIAKREKALVAETLAEITISSRVPEWMAKADRSKAKNIFDRNLNGIGKTTISFYEDTPQIVLVERTARIGSRLVEQFERNLIDEFEDLTRVEFGSLEATVISTANFKTHPAIKIREWVTEVEIHCVFTSELAERVGPNHSWSETWSNRRVLLTGQIYYKRNGDIAHIQAEDMEDVDHRPLKYKDISDPDFTSGMSVVDYLNMIMEQEGA